MITYSFFSKLPSRDSITQRGSKIDHRLNPRSSRAKKKTRAHRDSFHRPIESMIRDNMANGNGEVILYSAHNTSDSTYRDYNTSEDTRHGRN